MAFRETFRIEGLSDLDAALTELPKATARNVLVRTLKTEAQPIADMASSLAPDDPATKPPDLHTSIIVGTKVSRRAKKQKQSDVEVYVGPTTKAFYGQFDEFGTSRQAAKPFMRPAWDANWRAVLDGIKTALAAEIEKARKRLARKAEREAAKLKSGK